MTIDDSALILDNINDLKCDIKDIKKRLFGNGKEGLMDRVKGLETMHLERDKNEIRWRYFFTTCLAIFAILITILNVF